MGFLNKLKLFDVIKRCATAFPVLIFLSVNSQAMPKNTFAVDCLFSSISGVITLKGVPAEGATIKRTVGKAHVRGDIQDETKTDKKGAFYLPAVFERNILSRVLPMEFAVSQKIIVIYEGNEFDLWLGVKRQREENAEAKGQPLVVECHLEEELNQKQVSGGVIFSRCHWKVEEDEIIRLEDLPGPGQ
nr:DUF6795 domain-containing protein [Teredinibacter turnerae]